MTMQGARASTWSWIELILFLCPYFLSAVIARVVGTEGVVRWVASGWAMILVAPVGFATSAFVAVNLASSGTVTKPHMLWFTLPSTRLRIAGAMPDPRAVLRFDEVIRAKRFLLIVRMTMLALFVATVAGLILYRPTYQVGQHNDVVLGLLLLVGLVTAIVRSLER